MIGNKFGRLTIVARYRKNNRTYVDAMCDCGNITTVREDHIKSGRTSSCGCSHVELAKKRLTTHGMANTR